LLWHPSLTAINLSYTFPILETSATALCGTTGIIISCSSLSLIALTTIWWFLFHNIDAKSNYCFVIMHIVSQNALHYILCFCQLKLLSFFSILLNGIECIICLCYQRKFRSQTSNNMERWKAETRRVEERKRKSQKKEDRRKQIQPREMIGKSRIAVFFDWFVGPGGSKSSLAKAAVQSHLLRWEMKNLHAAVAQITCWTQQVKKLTVPGHV